jgi:hypothetical protein
VGRRSPYRTPYRGRVPSTQGWSSPQRATRGSDSRAAGRQRCFPATRLSSPGGRKLPAVGPGGLRRGTGRSAVERVGGEGCIAEQVLKPGHPAQ